MIVFDTELVGLIEQHRRVTTHLPAWCEALQRYPYGHRVWQQRARGAPDLLVGKRKAKRASVLGG